MCVCVCSHIPDEGRYLQACFFKIFFVVWCVYCSVGSLSVSVSEKNPES